MLSKHKVHFRYMRLFFDFHGAAAIFQASIDAVKNKLPEVIAYLDVLLITIKNLKRISFVFVLNLIVYIPLITVSKQINALSVFRVFPISICYRRLPQLF